MIDVYELYQSFTSETNISVGGWWRIQTDFLESCNDASFQLWDKYTSMAERSQEVTDKLRAFLKKKNIIVVPKGVTGFFDPPKDYERYASARIIVHKELDETIPDKNIEGGKCIGGEFEEQEKITADYLKQTEERAVDKIANMRWGSVCDHETKKPTLAKPKITQMEGGFEVAPRDVSVIVLNYYIKPPQATFNYTIAAGNPQTGNGGQIIYNKTSSQGLPWPETMIPEFLNILKAKYSNFTRDGFLSQSANQERQMQNAKQ